MTPIKRCALTIICANLLWIAIDFGMLHYIAVHRVEMNPLYYYSRLVFLAICASGLNVFLSKGESEAFIFVRGRNDSLCCIVGLRS